MAGGARRETHRYASPAGPRPYQAGDRITEKYQLLRELDGGGMGTVWVAHNVVLDVQVALKLIRKELAAPVFAARLLREARTAASLDHPAIVRTLDFGHSERGEPFIVMELLEGEPLSKQLDRERRLDPVLALRTLLPIADGLRAMHGRGMIHRDVKPDNIFIARDDAGRLRPKLLDFGLARVQAAGAPKLTLEGAVMGSPDYISPEQALGHDLDHGTDVWAFSVVLYEAIAGTRPFVGLDLPSLCRAILQDTPIPTVQRGAGDDELWVIIAAGLCKQREDRWSSMSALGEALARWVLARGATADLSGALLQPTWLADAGGEIDVALSSRRVPAVPTTPLPPSSVSSVRVSPVLPLVSPRRATDPMPVLVQTPPRAPAVSLEPATIGAPTAKSPRTVPASTPWRRPLALGVAVIAIASAGAAIERQVARSGSKPAPTSPTSTGAPEIAAAPPPGSAAEPQPPASSLLPPQDPALPASSAQPGTAKPRASAGPSRRPPATGLKNPWSK